MMVTDEMVDKLAACLDEAEIESPWMDTLPILRRVLEAVLEDLPDPHPLRSAPAWVEPLASSWEQRARDATSDTLTHFGAHDPAAICAAKTGEHVARSCAQELRERATRGAT
jgi:hypothetical protein